MTFARAAELATWRAQAERTEGQCMSLFGIGRETLQRIESGEVEPEPDVAARIGRFLDQASSCPRNPPGHGSRSPLTHDGDRPGAGGVAQPSAAGASFGKASM